MTEDVMGTVKMLRSLHDKMSTTFNMEMDKAWSYMSDPMIGYIRIAHHQLPSLLDAMEAANSQLEILQKVVTVLTNALGKYDNCHLPYEGNVAGRALNHPLVKEHFTENVDQELYDRVMAVASVIKARQEPK